LVLNDPDLGDKARAELIELIVRRHYLRIRCDIAAQWRIVVSVREIGSPVTGETHVATFSWQARRPGCRRRRRRRCTDEKAPPKRG
jgi:hypothetical protein